MKISASIKSELDQHKVIVHTNESSKELQISPKPCGFGSSVNGGELLLLSLATCFCNDIYREADKRGLTVSGVEVEFTGEFGAEGELGSNFKYKANVTSEAPAAEIEKLIAYVDQIAEIHNTLRKGLSISLTK